MALYRWRVFLFCLILALAQQAVAQTTDPAPAPATSQSPDAQTPPPTSAPTPDTTEIPEGMTDYQFGRLRALDKITALTVTFEGEVGKTIHFGSLFIKMQACRKSSPMEKPEAAAFLQIWEAATQDAKNAPGNSHAVSDDTQGSRWVFSGWMFASSPALSTMDHPIYDVWVLDCLQEKQTSPQNPTENPSVRPGEGQMGDDEAPQSPEIQRDILSP